MIPYVDLAAQNGKHKEEILAAVARVLDHGWFILGPEVKELEAKLAQRLGVKHVIGVANGTDALVLALRARGIECGDDVLTVSHSFVATASSIALLGARPIFVDVDPTTMLMDPTKLEAARTEKTRAVMPVHLNGHACDMDAIGAFCEKHGLVLIEDCAQAIGTTWAGKSVGGFGVGCFSLHPLKALAACGDAGFVATSDDETADKLRRLRNLGLIDRDHCGDVAPNSRLDTLHAAILLVKLAHLDEGLERRRAHAAAYREALAPYANDGRVVLPPDEGEDDVTWSAFVIRHPRRDELMTKMRERGVDVKAHYPLAIHQQPAFAHHEVDLPVTEKVVSEILSLPVTAELSDLDRDRVIEQLMLCLDELN